MSFPPDQGEIIASYFATRRKIKIVEKKALDKIPNRSTNPDEKICSFCFKPESETVFLINAEDKACICPECVLEIADMLNSEI